MIACTNNVRIIASQPFQCAVRGHVAPRAALRRRCYTVECSKAKGFDNSRKTKSTSKALKPRKVNIAKEMGLVPKTDRTKSEEETGSWIKVGTLDLFDKPIKPVILKTGKSLCLYKVGDQVYCSDAASTAYQFPLVDAKIMDVEGAPIVEVPLDGTQYDLRTGEVFTWCPANSPLRALLGTLKAVAKPVNLPVYRTKVSELGNVFVSLV